MMFPNQWKKIITWSAHCAGGAPEILAFQTKQQVNNNESNLFKLSKFAIINHWFFIYLLLLFSYGQLVRTRKSLHSKNQCFDWLPQNFSVQRESSTGTQKIPVKAKLFAICKFFNLLFVCYQITFFKFYCLTIIGEVWHHFCHG